MFLSTLKIELISWQVDLVRVDLVTIYLDLVTPSQKSIVSCKCSYGYAMDYLCYVFHRSPMPHPQLTYRTGRGS